MIEYMIAVVILLSTVTVMALLLYTTRKNSSRVLDLVASDYP